MQINFKKVILPTSLGCCVLFSGCANQPQNYVEIKNNNLNSYKEQTIDRTSLTSISKQHQEENIFYYNYLKTLDKKQKIKLVSLEPSVSTTLIPKMYLNIDSFEELTEVLEELQQTYTVIFDNESSTILQSLIKKGTIIDMSKRDFTYEELMNKISLKFDISFKRTGNVYKFYSQEEQKFFIPYDINMGNAMVDNSDSDVKTSTKILKTIKGFLNKKNKFTYDKLSGYLYVKAEPSTLYKIKNYIEDLDSLNNITYNFNIYAYEVRTVKGINWTKLLEKMKELNIKGNVKNNSNIDKSKFSDTGVYYSLNPDYSLQTGDEIRDSIRDYLSDIGANVEYIDQYVMKTKNNKENLLDYTTTVKYPSGISKMKVEDREILKPIYSQYKVGDEFHIIPRYNKNTDSIDIETYFKIRKLEDMDSDYVEGLKIENPTVKSQIIKNNFSVKDNSYIVLGASCDRSEMTKSGWWEDFKDFFREKKKKEIVYIIEVSTVDSVGKIN